MIECDMVKKRAESELFEKRTWKGPRCLQDPDFSEKRFASYPNVCQIGNSFKKSEL